MTNEKVYARIGFRKGLPNIGRKTQQMVAVAEIHSLSGQAPYFSLTGELNIGGQLDTCGCMHEDVAKHFPFLAKFIKWHLVSTEGPMHYFANADYWLKEKHIDNLKSTIVYGALPTDALVDLTHIDAPFLRSFLSGRLPELLETWKADMGTLFSRNDGAGYVDVEALTTLGIHVMREEKSFSELCMWRSSLKSGKPKGPHMNPIGWMIPTSDGKWAVVGNCCGKPAESLCPTQVYYDNIYPYRQNCITCGKELVAGQTRAWPELFDGKAA